MPVAFDAADHEEDHSDQASKEEENGEDQRLFNAARPNSSYACGLVHPKRRKTRRYAPNHPNETSNKANHKDRNPAVKPLLIIARFHETRRVVERSLI